MTGVDGDTGDGRFDAATVTAPAGRRDRLIDRGRSGARL